MSAYISPINSSKDNEYYPVDSTVEVYRRENDNRYEVVVEYADRIEGLGIGDASVSRKKNGTAPVVFKPLGDRKVVVQNNGTTNPVTIDRGVGVEPVHINKGNSETLTDTCRIGIGFNTKLELGFSHDTISIPPDEPKHSPVTVPPAQFVRISTDNLMLRVQHDSPAECLKAVRNIHTFVEDHPVSVSDYDDVCERLEELVEQLDTKLSGPHRTEWPDPEWTERFDLVTDRIVGLYARDKSDQSGGR